MTLLSNQKKTARKKARDLRKTLFDPQAGEALIAQFPHAFGHKVIAGFAPLGDEIDVWPLLKHLHASGRQIGLPIVNAAEKPLDFRAWTPASVMTTDRYGVEFPVQGAALSPTLVLVPLLAFTPNGARLGYGGGYYDRTLAQLRSQSDVFACGVAYAGQEVAQLPTDAHDQRLDGILTPTDFRIFT